MRFKNWVGLVFIAGLVTGCAHFKSAKEEKTVSVAEATKYMEEVYIPQHFMVKKGNTMRMPKHAEKAWEWFVTHRSDRTGHVPINYREKSLAYSRKFNRPTLNSVEAKWSFVGPINQGSVQPEGRIVDLAVNPKDDNLIYAATASGGVWKTTDRGLSWVNVTDNKIPTLGCGSIAMDPNDPNTVLVGLGEGMTGTRMSFIEPLGTGIYKTTDGGETWSLLPGTGDGEMQFVVDIRFVGDSNTILAGATGGQFGEGRGRWLSTDAGASWTKASENPTWSISVDPNPDDEAPQVLMTTFEVDPETFELSAKIYGSSDGGATDYPTTHPVAANGFRIELARSPSLGRNGEKIIYALIGDISGNILNDKQGDTVQAITGIWKSEDGGRNWNVIEVSGIPLSGDYFPGQMTYNNCMIVDPDNPDRLFLGSNLRGYRSEDGGQFWFPFCDWDPDDFDGLPFVHADHHIFAFGSNTGTLLDKRMFMGTDGGFFVSDDSGFTWTERNNGIVCTQIYRISNHPTLENVLMMGTQDNDKYLRKASGGWHHWPNSFGDCMANACLPQDSQGDTYMGCNYYGLTMRYATSGNQNDWDFLRLYGIFNNGIPDFEMGAWVTPFMLDPKHPENIWVALEDVYRRQYHPTAVLPWTRIVDLSSDYRSHIWELMDLSWGETDRQVYLGFARRGPTNILVNGIIRADIGDGTMDRATNKVQLGLPREGYLGALKCDPSDNDTLWITYSDFLLPEEENSRIFVSHDQGLHWDDKTGNFPKSLPAIALFIDPANSNTVIVGTDLGCYRTDDGGTTWYEFNQGLPNVVVSDFAFYPPKRLLRVGTYGRGMWETLLDGSGVPDIAAEPSSLTFAAPASPAISSVSNDNLPVKPAQEPGSPVGASDATSVSSVGLAGQAIILNENFEADFPMRWTQGGNPTWGLDDLRKVSGSLSVWCARDGTKGVDPETALYYPHDVNATLTYGPFDLSDALEAFMTYSYYLDTEQDQDFFTVKVSTSPSFTSFGSVSVSGFSRGFVSATVDFSNVPSLGSLLGQGAVYVQFQFTSDDTIEAAGLWLDDVIIRKTAPGPSTIPSPGGVIASRNLTDRVRIQWNATPDATQYQVWRHKGTDNALEAVAVSGLVSGTSFEDTTVEPGVPYYFYVKAMNSVAQSSLSAGALGSATGVNPRDLVILNTGQGPLQISDVTIKGASPWLSITPSSSYPIKLLPSSSATFAVQANPTDLAEGTYTDQLLVFNSAPGKSPLTVNVTLQVGTPLSSQVADYILGKTTQAPTGGDANGDGSINVGDMILLLNQGH